MGETVEKIYCCDRDNNDNALAAAILTSEVEAQKANAEQVLASASKAQNIIDKAPSLLAELNPMYKEKQETEQRFGKIEGSIGEMKELMKKQQEMMENFIKKFES